MTVIHKLLLLAVAVSVNAQVMPSCSDVDSNGHVEIPSGVTSIPDVSNALSGSLCSACVPLPAHVHVSFRCHADTPGVDTHQGNTTVRGRAPSVHRALSLSTHATCSPLQADAPSQLRTGCSAACPAALSTRTS